MSINEPLKNKLAQKAQSPRAKDPAGTIAAYLEKMKPQIAMALPKHVTADRLARIALTTIRLNPKLLECRIESLMGAIMQSAQLGLEPGPLGHCYLVPFRNGKTGQFEVQFIIGYKGLIELVRRSDRVSSISAHIVYSNDDFELVYGTEEKLVHRPKLQNRGEPVFAYMVAKLRDGGHAIEVMTVEDIEAVRRLSKAADNGPWVDHWEEMARKTVVRRGCKYLPLSIEIQNAIVQDETVKVDLAPDMTDVIDVSAMPAPEMRLEAVETESAADTAEAVADA